MSCEVTVLFKKNHVSKTCRLNAICCKSKGVLQQHEDCPLDSQYKNFHIYNE